MSWKVGEAKQHFSEVLRRAARHPQSIYNRDELVAVIIGASEAARFHEWRQQHSGSTAEALGEIQRICAEEGYALEPPGRRDRENALLKVADARRHERR